MTKNQLKILASCLKELPDSFVESERDNKDLDYLISGGWVDEDSGGVCVTTRKGVMALIHAISG